MVIADWDAFEIPCVNAFQSAPPWWSRTATRLMPGTCETGTPRPRASCWRKAGVV